MSEMAGYPYGGRDEQSDSGQLPGERPVSDDEQVQQPPAADEQSSEYGSRAAREGTMSGAAEPAGDVSNSAPQPDATGPSEVDSPVGRSALRQQAPPAQR